MNPPDIPPGLDPLRRVLRQRAWNRSLLGYCQSVGPKVRVNGTLVLSAPAFVSMGGDVRIGRNCVFQTEGGLAIGDGAVIGNDDRIETMTPEFVPGRIPAEGQGYVKKSVLIGPHATLGSGVILKPGARIGAGASVPDGAVVEGDVPAVETVPARDGGDLLFILGTGRSGSQALARILDQHPDVTGLHEPRPQLIRLSTTYAHGDISPADMRGELEALYAVTRQDRGKWRAESDQKFWNLADMLQEILPGGKFVWVLRDARAAVDSLLKKGLYAPEDHPGPALFCREEGLPLLHDHQAYRLRGDACGEMSGEEWSALSPRQKCCWYYGHVNATLARSFNRIPTGRRFFLRLEQLETQLPGLQEWLGLRHCVPLRNERHNEGLRVDTPLWSAADNECFDRWCRPIETLVQDLPDTDQVPLRETLCAKSRNA